MAQSTEPYRRWHGLLAAVVGLLALTACTVDTPELSEPSPSRTAAETQLNQLGPSEPGIQIETLEFAIQQDTFLSHIEDTRRELGDPKVHRFVELTTSDDVLWQGERLVYADTEVLFLQQAAGDGVSAVRIDIPAGADFQVERDLPSDIVAPVGRTADVEILNVRARLVDEQVEEPVDEPAAWSFDVTVAHPDTGWEDYADGWHVETSDGRILGTRILLHPHVGEQPFTRSLGDVAVAGDVEAVRIRAHDLVSGYGPAGKFIPLGKSNSAEGYEVVH